ncbi:MAG TPA: M56 family metallopeptidase, partial [Pirellulales bacterium]|nr:M56 family metallopeptidase [Pirellulales bacterium]
MPKAAIWERLVEQGRGGLRASIHWLALAWCAGVVVLSLRLAMGIVGVERAKRTGARPAAAIDATVAALTRRLRVSRPVRVLQSTLAEVPTTIGWLRPYILLPASAMTGLSTSELEAVLAHELAHVRRHDYVVNVAQIVVETLLFYHPAVWWLSGRIRREREHCCDDWAVAVCGNRMTFARALVTLEGLRGPAGRLALAASGGSLRERVLRLVGRPARHSASRSGWWAAAVVVLATLAAIGIGAVASPRALGTTPPNTDAAEAASGVGSPPEAETAKTEGEPAKTMRIFLQAAVGKQLTLETRKVERPSAPPEVVTHVDRGARITIDEPSGPKLRIAAERISLTLSADAGIKLRGGDLQASFPPDTMAQVSCNGNVRVEWGETTLAAETIELNLGEERLVASGRVRVVHRETRIEADKVQFIFADGRFEIQGAEVFGGTAVDKLSATTWGDVRNGWQLGLRWKLGHVEHAVGEEAWYEVVARNPGQNAIMVPVTKGEHSDVTLYAGNKIQIRIHGGERENVVLLPGEERVLDVWRSRLSTDGLAEGEYKVAVRTADDDVPPPLGLRLTAPSTPREPGAPRDLKGSAVADTGEPEADPETIAWGEPVLGLQAGVRFVTSLSRRKSRNLIEAQVFVCNTTEREVEIEYLHHTPLDFAPVVRDGDGRELEALLILTGPKFNETRVLPPGRPVLV